MIFPLIDNIYEYNGHKWICWQQDLFRKVYLRSVVDHEYEGSKYVDFNWWDFARHAVKIGKLPKMSKNY